jgi:hypothetical protein
MDGPAPRKRGPPVGAAQPGANVSSPPRSATDLCRASLNPGHGNGASEAIHRVRTRLQAERRTIGERIARQGGGDPRTRGPWGAFRGEGVVQGRDAGRATALVAPLRERILVRQVPRRWPGKPTNPANPVPYRHLLLVGVSRGAFLASSMRLPEGCQEGELASLASFEGCQLGRRMPRKMRRMPKPPPWHPSHAAQFPVTARPRTRRRWHSSPAALHGTPARRRQPA